jgi:hypothetical protein
LRHAGYSSRIYRAPQSTMRSEAVLGSTDKTFIARRRRQQQNNSQYGNSPQVSNGSPASEHSSRRGSTSKKKKFLARSGGSHESDDSSSIDSIRGSLEAPCLWMDDVEGYVNGTEFSNSWTAGGRTPSESRQRKPRVNNKSSASVASDHFHGDEASVHTLHTVHSMYEVHSSKLSVEGNDNGSMRRRTGGSKRTKQPLVSFWNSHYSNRVSDKKNSRLILLSQVSVLLAFVLVVWDSRRRVNHHKHQLEQLDEERAHILEHGLIVRPKRYTKSMRGMIPY